MKVETNFILSVLPWCLMLLVLLVMNVMILIFITKKKNTTVTANSTAYKPTMTEEQIKKIINTTVNDTFIKRQALVYDLNNVRYYELQDELKVICAEIESVFSDSFKKEFAFYYTKEYLYKYIVNLVELLLLDDLKQRRVR